MARKAKQQKQSKWRWLFWIMITNTLYLIAVPGLDNLRIDAVVLLIVYLSLYQDFKAPLILSFVVGLSQDLVSLSLIGQHALGLVAACFFAERFRDRLRMLPVIGQLPAIFFILLLVKFIYSWVVALNVGQLPDIDAVLSALLTAVFWIPLSYIWSRGRVDARPAVY